MRRGHGWVVVCWMVGASGCDSNINDGDFTTGDGTGGAGASGAASSVGGAGAGGGAGASGNAGGAGASGGDGAGGTLTGCDGACAKVAACGEDGGPSCIAECESLSTPECGAEADALIACINATFSPPECEADCDDEDADYDYCATGECGGGTCSVDGDGSCICGAFCGSLHTIGIECSAPSAGGIQTCDCLVDDILVGTCDAPEEEACSTDGCCAAFF